MAAKTVGFAIAPELRPELDEVVEHFGHGNRSEFLRVVVHDYQARLKLERMHAVRKAARDELGGRTFSSDEVLALIATTAAS